MRIAVVLLASFLASFFSMSSFAADVPTVSADLGPCSAKFTVTDGKKPIYNAKVRTRIRWGAFGLRKVDLEVGTDANGQAIMNKLPDSAEQGISFEIASGGVSRTVLQEPEEKCNAEFEVALRRPAVPPASNPQP